MADRVRRFEQEPERPSLLTKLRGSFAQTGQAMSLAWRASRGATIALAVLTVIGAALPPILAYVGKLIIDAVVAARLASSGAERDLAVSHVLRWVLVEVGIALGLALIERGLGLVRQLLGAWLSVGVNVRILNKALTLELPHFENSEFYDKLTKARREAGTRPLAMITETFQIVRQLLMLSGYAGLLVAFRPWMLAVVIAAGLPAYLSERHFSRRGFDLWNWRSPERRRLNYLEYVLTNDEHAKEVKLFGLGELLLARFRTASERFYREDRALAVRRSVWGYLLSIISTAAFYACYSVIVFATVTGTLSLGDMALYLVTFRQSQQAFLGLLSSFGGMYEHNLYMKNLFEYLSISTERPPHVSVAPREERGIRFEQVGFRYPDAERWALREVDVFIPDGQSLALVGENGAGKTTFIKLLTGLYRPTEGRVLLDGRDLREWDETELRRRIGVIFQDFNQYQFLVRENVALGSVGNMQDELRVHRAVERGGAKDVVGSLAKGLDTQLGRWFKDGAELSGGQWQKIGLARAFMREEADILILDEPTAALDAESEHAVFERFRELATGRTTIVISHRFPTVRMAERIVVFSEGRITEQGTHDELVARNGRYAHLFALQAAGYQ